MVEVVLLQPVTSLCHHVRYVLIDFKVLDVFSVTARDFFSNGLCVGVPFSEMSYCFIGLWISVEAKGRGQKFSELQEEGQSTSSVQVLKGQCTKLSRPNLFGCCNVRLKKGSVNVPPLTKPL